MRTIANGEKSLKKQVIELKCYGVRMMFETHSTYNPLDSYSDPSFDEFYKIYVDSLPPSERKSKEQIAAIITSPDYRTLLLKSNDEVIGFSILFIPPGEMFYLLEYMAIHSAYRNLGYGGALFLQTFQDVVSIWGLRYGLLEVDSDREQSADQEMRRRRQHFYRRLGCLRVDGLSYILPLPGEDLPPQMDILVYQPEPLPPIGMHQFEHWLKVIYNKVYDCSSDDPRIAQMMKAIGDPVKLI